MVQHLAERQLGLQVWYSTVAVTLGFIGQVVRVRAKAPALQGGFRSEPEMPTAFAE